MAARSMAGVAAALFALSALVGSVGCPIVRPERGVVGRGGTVAEVTTPIASPSAMTAEPVAQPARVSAVVAYYAPLDLRGIAARYTPIMQVAVGEFLGGRSEQVPSRAALASPMK